MSRVSEPRYKCVCFYFNVSSKRGYVVLSIFLWFRGLCDLPSVLVCLLSVKCQRCFDGGKGNVVWVVLCGCRYINTNCKVIRLIRLACVLPSKEVARTTSFVMFCSVPC